MREILDDHLAHLRKALSSPHYPRDTWQVRPSDVGLVRWIEACPTDQAIPDQGWKLHITANPQNAAEVFARSLPILLGEKAPFKLTRSPADLFLINTGKAGPSQIGKFITVYPQEHTAVPLAILLDKATRGLSGPCVPTDRRVSPTSIVSYRYGAFKEIVLQSPVGEPTPALRSPSGDLVPDRRQSGFSPPVWSSDPFVACGLLPPWQPPTPLVHDRYLCVDLLHNSFKGSVYLAIDIRDSGHRAVVLKKALRHTYLDMGEADCADLLRRERAILESLDGRDICPAPLDWIEDVQSSWLVLEYKPGMNLLAFISSFARRGHLFDDKDVVELAVPIGETILRLHDQGFVHRDLKPANLLVLDDASIRLLDFDLAATIGDQDAIKGAGTRGYRSPQQYSGGTPDVRDDVYGFGALLRLFCTFLDPALAPDEWLCKHDTTRMNPRIGARLARVVVKCLSPEPEDRYRDFDEALRSLGVAARPSRPRKSRAADPINCQQLEFWAFQLGEQLCRSAIPYRSGASWRSTHSSAHGLILRDLNVGAAGIGLFLVDLYRATGNEMFKLTAINAAHALADFDYDEEPFLPGLFIGESGVGLFLLAAGLTFNETYLIDSARRAARAALQRRRMGPDWFNGLAGIGWFQLVLGTALDDNVSRQAAATVAHELVGRLDASDGRYLWRQPTELEGLSGEAFLGFAHGCAGIAYFLAEFDAAVGDRAAGAAARGVGEYLAAQAVPALWDDSGLNWPDIEGGGATSAFWCHGAGGVGRLFLRLFQIYGDDQFRVVAERAGRFICHGAKWISPVQCHGLAGSIEFALDLLGTTHSAQWLNCAGDLGYTLAAHRQHSEEGDSVWASEEPTVTSPDFMVGYAGVGEALLRLAAPAMRPYLFTTSTYSEMARTFERSLEPDEEGS